MTTIPNFTKSDYLETNIPYKFVADNANNPLEEAQLIQRVCERALVVGVCSFKKLYCIYKNSEQANN